MAFRTILYDKRKKKRKREKKNPSFLFYQKHMSHMRCRLKYKMCEREKTNDIHEWFHYAILYSRARNVSVSLFDVIDPSCSEMFSLYLDYYLN